MVIPIMNTIVSNPNEEYHYYKYQCMQKNTQ